MLPSEETPCLGTDEQVGAGPLPGDKTEFSGYMGMPTGLTVGWGWTDLSPPLNILVGS